MASKEMGKPIVQARAEVEKCAVLCDWYADNGAGLLHDQNTSVGEQAYISFLPPGAILAVMSWNFPYWQTLRGAVPILLGGNGYVLKHAPNVMGCAYMMREAWSEAGLPAGVFSVLNIKPELVSKAIADPRIAAVTVTGSVRAGSAIAAQAGAALKKTVLELGGVGPVHRACRRRSGSGGECCGCRSVPEQRTNLHRGQADHSGGAPEFDTKVT